MFTEYLQEEICVKYSMTCVGRAADHKLQQQMAEPVNS